jgi:hypothetical protein
MYLAREGSHNSVRYFIRQSYKKDGCLKSRNLYDLGSDPTQFIIYPGGNGYYYEPDIIDALAHQGIDVDQTDLDPLFFDFLHPEIQRVIAGFDRHRRGARNRDGQAVSSAIQIHLFDKKRFYFLRFGAGLPQQSDRLPEKIFRPLANQSRDELEQYFLTAETILKPHEVALYVATIFNLNRFLTDPKSTQSALAQLDQYFLTNLCQLDSDTLFWSGTPTARTIHTYLIRYVIMYFDHEMQRSNEWQHYYQEFIHHHRAYHPPPMVQKKIEEAETLFGLSWKALKQLDRTRLARRYRRLALKHHPDQGGDPNLFNRLTQYYQALLSAINRK